MKLELFVKHFMPSAQCYTCQSVCFVFWIFISIIFSSLYSEIEMSSTIHATLDHVSTVLVNCNIFLQPIPSSVVFGMREGHYPFKYRKKGVDFQMLQYNKICFLTQMFMYVFLWKKKLDMIFFFPICANAILNDIFDLKIFLITEFNKCYPHLRESFKSILLSHCPFPPYCWAYCRWRYTLAVCWSTYILLRN